LNTVWKFASADEIHRLVDGFLNEIARAAVCQHGVIQALDWCVNEIMDNVLQHAETTHGYVMGQIHPASQHIAFCIYDYGRGIFNSLRRTQHAPRNAVDAITLAVKEGVTRDKAVGQGNGMWGLYNIVRSNFGILNITSGSGFFGVNGDDTKTSTNVPFLNATHNCTTVDFQIDFDKGISISEALDGHEPANLRVENLEDDRNNVVYRLADKSSGTGTRQSGAAIRNEVINITKQTDSIVLLDFNGVSVISSSFADEFIGKLAVEFGFIGFTQRFRLVGMNATVQAITNRSVSQRLGVGNGE
jgi:anti-sigma regulatory factor (Ser/Thr protein kinase)